MNHSGSDFPEMSDVVRLASVPGQYAFFRWNNVAINIWATQPTAPIVRSLAELTAQSTRACPEGISSIHWVTRDAELPTREARAGLRELSRRYNDHIKNVGVVLDGSGFWASALRAALNGIAMAAEVNFVPRLYANLDSLVDWLPEAHQRGTGLVIRGGDARSKILGALRTTLPDYKPSNRPR